MFGVFIQKGTVKEELYRFKNEADAYEVCCLFAWELRDENDFKWEMYYEEVES